MSLKVGESYQSGTVTVTRIEEHKYVAECAQCGWRKRYEFSGQVNWFTFTHNRNRRKEGCPKDPERDEG